MELTIDTLTTLADALESLDNPGAGYEVKTNTAEIEFEGSTYLVRRNKDGDLYIGVND